MTIKNGTGVIKRRHAKNFIQDEANRRFEECVRPYQQQGLNALGVDFFEVQLYQKAFSTQVCTCKQTEIAPQHSSISLSLPPNAINPDSSIDSEIVIDYSRPLFGNLRESENLDYTSAIEFSEDDLIEESLEDDEIPTKTSENLFSANSNCGICYRTGFVPGYTLYGWDRKVLTTYEMSNIYGYHINQSKAPHVFDKQDSLEGFVDFTFTIPLYFKAVRYSVRNNHDILLDEGLYLTSGSLLSLQDLVASKGQQITIRVKADTFTHVVIEFDLGIKINANISQQSKSINWTQLDTLGSMTVVLPMTIQEVQSTDFIYVPSRHQVLKITDTPYLRTAKDQQLDWLVTTRIVQPTEPVKKIYKGNWLM